MDIEYEATFSDIDKDDVRRKLKSAGARLVQAETLHKRVVFNLPKGQNIKGAWLRVRDEGDKITMSLKITDGSSIENTKETCLKVDNFENAEKFLKIIGCQKKAYQENRREVWRIDAVEIMIDEWPFLEPFVEIEGISEKEVKDISQKLGFDYSKAIFGPVGVLYSKKYNIPEHIINNKIPKIIFEMKNPFYE